MVRREKPDPRLPLNARRIPHIYKVVRKEHESRILRVINLPFI